MMTMQKVTRKASVTQSLTAFLVGISINYSCFIKETTTLCKRVYNILIMKIGYNISYFHG